jgi:hypothetical protein
VFKLERFSRGGRAPRPFPPELHATARCDDRAPVNRARQTVFFPVAKEPNHFPVEASRLPP